MLLLGIETSSKKGGVALVKNGKRLAAKVFTTTLGHSERIVPACHALLRRAKVSVEDLDAIAVGVGPGSYTGLRVGIAAAKGLAFLNQIPIVGVPSLDALVLAHRNKIKKEVSSLYAVVDAKRGESYVGLYQRNQNRFLRKGKIKLIPNAALEKLRESGRFLCGPEANRFFPTAEAVALLAAPQLTRSRSKPAAEPRPIYIRPFVPLKSKEHKSVCFVAAGRK